ncbi:hypothetical protein MPC1_4780003 [Methylocella tundrae]|nr:hypothetical protein MPC1_4780003 [Methylocella tundrae]
MEIAGRRLSNGRQGLAANSSARGALFCWKAAQNGDNLLIAHLSEVVVEKADGPKKLRRLQTNQGVGLLAKLTDRVGGSYRDGENKLRGSALAYCAQGGLHRRAGRDAIVDDDHCLSGNLRPGAFAYVALSAALDLSEFVPAGRVEFGARDAHAPDHVIIANDDGRGAIDHCSHRQLRLRRHADLADKNKVERRVERRRDLRRDRQAATRQCENHRLLALVARERLGQLAAGVFPVQEQAHESSLRFAAGSAASLDILLAPAGMASDSLKHPAFPEKSLRPTSAGEQATCRRAPELLNA